MNRALITDPDLPRKTREGRDRRCAALHRLQRLHHPLPRRDADPLCPESRTGRELTLPRATAADSRKRVAVVGGGPAGLAAAAELAGLGQSVVLLEAGDALGGQVRLAGASPSHAELADSLLANYETLLAAGDVEVRLGVRADAETLADLGADAVIVATGAAPFWPASAVGHAHVTHVWDILAGARPAGPVLIADWGGDQAALDCAELLAAEGYAVTLAEGAVTPGESLHQYNRNLYSGRLYRAGVTIEHHLGLTGVTATGGRFANIFAPELVRDIDAATVALSLGRMPAGRPRRRPPPAGHRVHRGRRLPLAARPRGGDPRGHGRRPRARPGARLRVEAEAQAGRASARRGSRRPSLRSARASSRRVSATPAERNGSGGNGRGLRLHER